MKLFSRKPRLRRPGGLRQRGGALLEFALVAWLLLLLMLAIADFSCLLWVHLTMEHAVREAGRFALTQRLEPSLVGPRHEQVIQVARLQSFGLLDQLQPSFEITVNGVTQRYATSGSYHSGMFGASQDRVQWVMDAHWPLMTPLIRPFFSKGEYHFRVATFFVNEQVKP